MIITIDGPAGSGKSTTAREVARRLGFLHLDSGALYRAFAFAASEAGWADPMGAVPAEKIAELAELDVDAEVIEGKIKPKLSGRLLGGEIRTPQVTACASWVSKFPAIRERVNAILRQIATGEPGAVCEGRDMGTVVFPHAELKVYLDAAPDERARRRLLQRGEDVDDANLRSEAASLVARDTQDSERDAAPLRVPDGAITVDTTHLSFEQQVERILAEAAKRVDMS